MGKFIKREPMPEYSPVECALTRRPHRPRMRYTKEQWRRLDELKQTLDDLGNGNMQKLRHKGAE